MTNQFNSWNDHHQFQIFILPILLCWYKMTNVYMLGFFYLNCNTCFLHIEMLLTFASQDLCKVRVHGDNQFADVCDLE